MGSKSTGGSLNCRLMHILQRNTWVKLPFLFLRFHIWNIIIFKCAVAMPSEWPLVLIAVISIHPYILKNLSIRATDSKFEQLWKFENPFSRLNVRLTVHSGQNVENMFENSLNSGFGTVWWACMWNVNFSFQHKKATWVFLWKYIRFSE